MNRYIITMLCAAGLLAGCSQSVQTASEKFNQLPPAVQKTIRAQAPDGEIADVSSKTQDGREVYQVELRDQGRDSRIVVATDGTLLSSDMPKPSGTVQRMLTPTGATGTEYSALPEIVQKTIRAQAPNLPIASITRHENNGRVIYEVSFKEEGKNPTLQVAEDGTVVQALQK